MNGVTIRPAQAGDRKAINEVEARAFGQMAEARLVEQLVADGEVVLELVAEKAGRIIGHVLFSRLLVVDGDRQFGAVALAPLAVDPDFQHQGIGSALVTEAHRQLQGAGGPLSVVLGDPAYYGRFGYQHERAVGFDSDYQCDALQALAWGDAPKTGRLVYAAAFGRL
ncbi:N-acetyltransferase [Pseudaminobacter arsenicus]|uniref:N-acetyltransferase n=1 Tax=Borborobacter arsenicus TaxID=1851146 RepID=A0A432VAS3_9HYPH|nr:N-acetyltransferase [Pseudaminobacter arsenicus]RUM99250.1 N-acetyltransferase [Pseudaminobacter arsenicus]